MTEDVVTILRAEYEALKQRVEDLEDSVAGRQADDGSRIPLAVVKEELEGAHPVRAWRRHRGLTQRELASTAGISLSLVNEIEVGKKTGSIKTLRRLAETLDTTVDCLLDD